MSTALQRVGFNVLTGVNQNYGEMLAIIVEFTALAEKADEALFYYAGQGFSYKGKQQLLPIDFDFSKFRADQKSKSLTGVRLNMIDLGAIVQALEKRSKTRIFLMDTSSNGPSSLRERFGSIGDAQKDKETNDKDEATLDRQLGLKIDLNTFIAFANGRGKGSPGREWSK